jgi:steroid 5-alpha reductase family enzyme
MSLLYCTVAATFAAFTALWALSVPRRDAGIVDFYWGPGFVVIAWLGWLLSEPRLVTDLVLVLPITLWGLRLGWYMVRRHGGAEDARYAAMRERHGSAFVGKSLWMVFWLQAAIQWIASTPALVVMAAPGGLKALQIISPLTPAIVASGLALFFAGFALEAAADRAVARFKADPANRGALLTSGLHAHVRHPNYLGEIVLQWGLGLIAFGLTRNPLAFIGPALMHALIAMLSGVPMLEAHIKERAGFADWKARTGALWPRFRR